MTEIQGWTRVVHRNTDDPEVLQSLEDNGSAVIAKWRNKATGVELVYTMDEREDQPYMLKLLSPLTRPGEGRYPTREDGGRANKQLMEENAILPTPLSQ